MALLCLLCERLVLLILILLSLFNHLLPLLRFVDLLDGACVKRKSPRSDVYVRIHLTFITQLDEEGRTISALNPLC